MHIKNLWRGTAGAAAVFASGLLVTSAAPAKIPNAFSALETVSDGELNTMRGGMWIGPFFFNFGLRIRTAVEGTMEMVTEMTMNPEGQWTETQTTSWVFNDNDLDHGSNHTEVAAVTPPDLSALEGLGVPNSDPTPTSDHGDGGLYLPAIQPPIPTETVGDPTAIADSLPIADILPVLDNPAPTGNTPTHHNLGVQTADTGHLPETSSGGPAATQSISGDGTTLSLNSGEGTQIIHEVTQGHIASIVNNTANGAIIETSTELDIQISNFQQVIAAALPAMKARAIASRINDAYFR